MKKFGLLLVILSLFATLLSAADPAGAADGQNILTNGGFEQEMTGWTLDQSTASTSWANKSNPHSGSYAFNWWNDAAFSVKVSQTVTGLPDGKYKLTAYSQGGGGESASFIFAETDGVKLSSSFANTGYSNWIETLVSNIEVSSESGIDGVVAIGLELAGSAEQWGSIDDFSLVRTGDLDAEPAQLTGLRPVTIDTLIHEAPALPSVVTAVYTDESTASLPVTWSGYEPEQLSVAGSFQLTGTVTGTELQAEATIRVNYRSFDVNGDGAVDIGDVAIVSYYAAVGGNVEEAADLNNNGTVNTEDIRLVVDALLHP